MAPRIRIDGLKLIAAYLRLSERQVRKLYAITVSGEHRLPVFRLSMERGPNARLSAWKDELDAWQDRMSTRDLYSAD